jgi:hypothetical protein
MMAKVLTLNEIKPCQRIKLAGLLRKDTTKNGSKMQVLLVLVKQVKQNCIGWAVFRCFILPLLCSPDYYKSRV